MTRLPRQKTDREEVREITIINTIIILAIIITFLTRFIPIIIIRRSRERR